MGSRRHTMSPTSGLSTLLLCCFLHSQVLCQSSEDKSEASARVFDVGDLSAAVTNLTSNYFLVKALLIYWIHLLFQTAGWALGSLLWNSLRPGVNDLDPDVPLAVSSGLLDTEFSGTNLGLALGQWIFYFVFWTGLLLLTDSSRSRQSSGGAERADFDLSSSVLETALDDLFAPHTIAKQTILNILGAVGGSVFVALQSHLPDSDLQNRRRETPGNQFLRTNQITEEEQYYHDYSGY